MVCSLDPETLSDESDDLVDNITKLLAGKPVQLVGFVLAELLAMYLSRYDSKESRHEMMRLHVVTALALAEFYEPNHARH